MFEGCFVALVTPFRQGAVDRETLDQLIDFHVDAGSRALVVCGTTGESPTLSREEQDLVIRRCVERGGGRFKVLAGTGTYDTRTTVEQTRIAAELGVDGVMVVSPYYNKPGRRGLQKHYLEVADRSPVPIMLYNIPGRTGSKIPVELVLELAKHPQIQAVKDATGSADDVAALVESGAISVMSGDDAQTLPWMALGARGVVSVAANVAPGPMIELVESMAQGDLRRARKVHFLLLPLFRALFVEANPGPVKALLASLGMGTGEVRLPLVEATPETVEALEAAVRPLGLASQAS